MIFDIYLLTSPFHLRKKISINFSFFLFIYHISKYLFSQNVFVSFRCRHILFHGMVKYKLKEINTNIYSIRLIERKDRIVQNDISQQMLEIILGMITAVKIERGFSKINQSMTAELYYIL